MMEDGWLYRGGKMALRISIDYGGSMRWDSVASLNWLHVIHYLTTEGK